LPFDLSVCPGTKVGVKLVGALAISPSDATWHLRSGIETCVKMR